MSLNEALPICEDNSTRTYSVVQLPIVDIYAKQWAPEVYELNDCMVLGYGEFEKGLHIFFRSFIVGGDGRSLKRM